MKIFEFIEEINRVVKEAIPGEVNAKVSVVSEGMDIGFEVLIDYTNPNCLLSNKHLSIAYFTATLDTDLSFRIKDYSVFPSFKVDIEESCDLSEFSNILKKNLEHERAQILFNSFIGK